MEQTDQDTDLQELTAEWEGLWEATPAKTLVLYPQPLRKKDIPTAERLQILQEKLYLKAKQEPNYKFYVLYDKLSIPYVLKEAWKSVKRKNSAAGVDGKRVADIESYGVEAFLEELGESLRRRTYDPKPIKRIYIEKPNGKLRPIGIGCISDRVVQTAIKQVIEPIFEADFSESSHGFRPKRSAQGAIREIKENLNKGYSEVYDADLSAYFDTIPHNKLHVALKQRISDPRLMQLIDKFLKAPIREDNQQKGGKSNKRGTPQGGILSPLLANIYMNLVDKAVERPDGIFRKAETKIVRYADDFVLMSKSKATEAHAHLQELLERMELQLNQEKTKCVNGQTVPFDFLGFTFRYDRDLYTKHKRYWNVFPSRKSVKKMKANIREQLHSSLHYSADKLTKSLNAKLRGWLNYFDVEGVSYPAMAKREVRYYMNRSIDRYYNRKSQRKSRLHGTQAFNKLVNKHGLIDPTKYSKPMASVV